MPPDYFADYEGSGHAQSLPSPGETPYQTPPTSMSRRSSSRRETSSPPMSSSPPPPMPDDTKRHSKDSATDENISIFDPRRFTPTLHANLVSEILSLRRELESKHKFIEDLESSLHSSKTENETLTRKLSHSTKEGRSVKRHLHQLENGTLAALEELAKDRDERKQAAEDLKDKVEKLEKKIKNQEDEEDRTLKLWERDRETWGNQKRVLERKVHVSESRLKNILAELAAEHAAEQEQHNGHDSEDEETRDSGLGNDSDTNSVHSTGVKRTPSKTSPSRKSPRHARNTSNASQRSLNRPYRFSTQSDAGKLGGLSLAEELDFDAGEEDVLDEIDEDEEEDFPEHEVRARRALSHRSSFDSDFKAKRVLGLAPDGQLPTVSETASLHMSALNSPDTEIFAGRTSHDSKTDSTGRNTRRSHYSEVAPEFIYSSVQYVDTGVQFSPPPSPVLTAQRVESAGTFYDDRTETDSAPNSRIQSLSTSAPTPTPFDAEAVNMTLERPAVVMVSAGAQTTDEPLSPPETPKVSQMEAFEDVEGPSYQDGHDKELEAIPEPQPEPEGKVEMFTMGTQTDPLEELMPLGEAPGSLRRNNKPEPLPIPSIAIHPPASAPGSPRETMLPPGTKNVATQTRTEELVAMRSISVQTDEIRIDRRLMKLPPHLLPSAISSSPNSPENIASNRFRSPDLEREDDVDGPTATPKQLSEKVLGKSPLIRSDIPSSPPAATVVSDTETEDRYPGNNDNGPLQPGMEHKIRRPFRGPSLFAGFDSDNEEKQADADDEDVPDIQSAPVPYSTTSFPRRPLRDLRNERSYPKPPTPVPEDKEVSGRGSSESIRQRAAQAGKVTARNSLENARVSKRPPSIRRSALIKGGATAHMQQGSRSRSPSLQSAGSSKRSSIQGNPSQPPPFPIPGRASSRRLFPISKSDGAQSPTPRSNSIYPGRRNQKGKHIARNDSLRKVKSAAVMPRRSKERSRSRSPPAPQRDSGPPPLPQDVITRSQFFYQAHRMSNSQTQPPTTATDTLAAASEGGQPTVIDAIAATMVGEWMWKYVRRRKSFNVAESPEDLSRTAQDGSINVTGNGSRHKRWVWISPYERSVMWSSKQPASGSALLGKSGRKRKFQFVRPKCYRNLS